MSLYRQQELYVLPPDGGDGGERAVKVHWSPRPTVARDSSFETKLGLLSPEKCLCTGAT